jgi:hypothetical protein
MEQLRAKTETHIGATKKPQRGANKIKQKKHKFRIIFKTKKATKINWIIL